MKNIKDRYCVGFYNRDERLENEEIYFGNVGNVLTSYIIDNTNLFNIRKLNNNDNKSMWITLKVSELEKIKNLLEDYKYSNKQEVLNFIDKCMNYSLWNTACECCDTINLNVIPYTHRGNMTMTISKSYNCLNCVGLTDRTAMKIRTALKEEGAEAAIRLTLGEDSLFDEEDKFFCECGADLRNVGIVYNGKRVIKFDSSENDYVSFTIDEYNKLELENSDIMPILYNEKYCENTNGYRCMICNHELSEKTKREYITNCYNENNKEYPLCKGKEDSIDKCKECCLYENIE